MVTGSEYDPDQAQKLISSSTSRHLSTPGFILARVVRIKNENGRKFTRKK